MERRMDMNENEIYDLFLQMRKKKIRQNELAEHLNVSCSWLSQCFSLKTKMSEQHLELVKEYIASK